MSHPEPYETGEINFTREKLEIWINQVEDFSGKSIAIHTLENPEKTKLTVDLDVAKPGPAKVLMGHFPAPGRVTGTAYIQNNAMDITISR